MTGFVLRRLAGLPLLLLVIYSGAVGLLMAAPGEGLETGEKDLPPEVLEQRRRAYNFDQPWYVRYYLTWPKRLLIDRDLPAYQYPDWTVLEIMGAALPVSLQLGVLALTFALALGLLFGVGGGLRPGSGWDALLTGFGLIGISLPTFVTGSLLLIVFSVWLHAAPVGGWGRLSQIWLPAITLALPYAAYIARLVRNALVEVYSADFVRTARAKGLPARRVLLEHALPHALLPVLSYLGPAAAAVFTGSFVVEQIFRIPGMGTHVVESINNRDQTLILATVMVYSTFLATLNLVVDVLYGWIDPRIRLAGPAR